MSLEKMFGDTALKARELLIKGVACTPRQAWNLAGVELFHRESYLSKGCPRAAFIGLCEKGLVKGVAAGDYSAGTMNKQYTLKALKMLRENPEWRFTKSRWWLEVTKDNQISHNHQLDVLIALYVNGFLNI